MLIHSYTQVLIYSDSHTYILICICSCTHALRIRYTHIHAHKRHSYTHSIICSPLTLYIIHQISMPISVLEFQRHFSSSGTTECQSYQCRSMRVCMYVCACMCMYLSVGICMFACMFMFVCMCLYIKVVNFDKKSSALRTSVSLDVSRDGIHTRMYTYIHTGRIHLHTHLYIYIYTHIYNSQYKLSLLEAL